MMRWPWARGCPHTWSAWKVIEEGNRSLRRFGEAEHVRIGSYYVQARRCETCGLTERKTRDL